MNRFAKLFTLAFVCLSLTACGVLEYPDYWEGDDHFIVNLVTLPFELVFTPIIFVLKLFPVL